MFEQFSPEKQKNKLSSTYKKTKTKNKNVQHLLVLSHKQIHTQVGFIPIIKIS